MNKSLLAMAVASLLPYAPVSLAQDTAADETVVVTANRFAQTLQSTTSPIEVVTRQDIERIQANNLLEVLRTLPGVQVAANGGYGQTQSLFVRGTNSSHVLVLIDGVRFGSATTGTASISAIPLVGVERIEFLRGSRAALYGSDAIGGVINIITATQGSEHQISATAGSDNYYSGQLLTSGQVTDDLHMSLGLSGVDTDGYSVQTSDPDDDGYRAKSVTANANYTISNNWDVGLLVMAEEGDVEFDGYYVRGDETLYNIVTRLNYHDEILQSRLTASTNQDKSNSFTAASDKSLYQTDRHEFSFDNQYALSNALSVGVGINWFKDDVSQSTVGYDESSRTNLGVYLSSLYQAEQYNVEAAVRSDDNQRYGQNTTWQLGAGYKINDVYRVTANAGTAFKAPTFNQLYYPGYGNPDIKPEKSKNYEVGMTAQYEFADFRFNIYRNELTDMIGSSPLQNYGEVTINGLEVGASFETGPLQHKLSYDLTDAEDKETGNELARRAKHSAKWNLFYELDQWSFNMDYLFQGKRFDDSSNEDKLAAYSLVDISTAYRFTNGVTLSGKVGNLFDKEYETAAGYLTPERKYYATVAYQF
ncbi:TonB-dependent receptor [Vibrio sp. H11]|uniref:TonB-dependent receptor domain-containing protein n=1 Tax=Vibrio sp. H11 TaxID=2565928 RepID=UPI0010A5C909|nr:TonB-dependent receptor [Vibrio sp. H11]